MTYGELMSPRKDYMRKYKSTILTECVKKKSMCLSKHHAMKIQTAGITPCTVNPGTKQRSVVSFKPVRRAPKTH
jgi:hypothetical protein